MRRDPKLLVAALCACLVALGYASRGWLKPAPGRVAQEHGEAAPLSEPLTDLAPRGADVGADAQASTGADADAGSDADAGLAGMVGALDELWQERTHDPQLDGEPALATLREGPPLRLVSAKGEVTWALVGGAGLYPALELRPDASGQLRLPVLELAPGFEALPRRYEILARGQGEAVWAQLQVSPEALESGQPQTLTLEPAAPLALTLRDAQGRPVAHARVQVTRGPLGALSRATRSDAAGLASFEALPPGEYWAWVRSDEHVALRVPVRHTLERRPEPLRLELGRQVYGCVSDAEGSPKRAVRVDAHVDRRGEPGAISAQRLLQIDAPRVEGSALSDAQGCFALSGLPAGVVYLVARDARGMMPARSGPLDLRQALEHGPVELRLEAGQSRVVRVVDEQGQPVRGATVRWRDEGLGAQGALVTDGSGQVTLQGVPASAWVDATLRRFAASARALEELEGDLVLKPQASLGPWRARLSAPRDVIVEQVQVRVGQARCRVEHERGQDWLVEGCPEGPATLVAQTRGHGQVMVQTRSGQDVELALPAPTPTTLEVSGLEQDALRSSALRLSAAGDGPGPLAQGWSALEQDGDQVKALWRGALYPGEYQAQVTAQDGERWQRVVRVEGEPGLTRWALRREVRVPIEVVDERGRAVSGARLVWLPEGQPPSARRALGVSQRGAPWLWPSRWPQRGQLVALTARAQGMTRVAAHQAPERLVVRLDQPAMQRQGWPWRTIEEGALASALGVTLARDEGALLIHVVDPRGAAARAGVSRGAAILDAWREPPQLVIWVEQQGQLQEHRLTWPQP